MNNNNHHCCHILPKGEEEEELIIGALSNEEKETLLITHHWLSVYCNDTKEESQLGSIMPAPRCTAHEAWLTLKMVLLLWGFADRAPAPFVRTQVPTPLDFSTRVYSLIQRLERPPPPAFAHQEAASEPEPHEEKAGVVPPPFPIAFNAYRCNLHVT
jgi:hypothetical protein